MIPKWIWVLIAGMLLGQACDSASTQTELQNNVQAEEDSIRKANLDREVQNVAERFGLMGMSLMVLDSGKKVYETYLGMADLGRNIKTSEKTTYRIASISKTMTATAVVQLYEKGKLDIDADIEMYLGYSIRNPRFPDEPITLRLLLSHKSSIRDGEGYGKFARNMISDSLNIKELFTKDGKYYTDDMFADHKPGAYFSYTNCTWGLIASIVEKVSGERFDDYCTKNIFEPLDMDQYS